MKSCLLLLCLLPFFPLFFAVSTAAEKAFNAKTIERRTDEWIGRYVAAGDFSGVVLIAEGDHILVNKAYGKADLQRSIANQTGTRFKIASLSKTFTAAGIELLIAQGKLSLKDHLSKYVDGIPNGNEITIEQLLLHRSGVGEFDAPEVYRDCLPNQELIRQLRGLTPLFAPGSDSQYSNEGYFLLAVIIEKVSGVSYATFLQEDLFDPLKLANTGSTCKEMPAGLNARGSVPGAKTNSVVPLPFEEAAIPGPGSLYSSANDLYTWLKAVNTNSTFQVQHLDYPYGWGKRNYSGRELIEQSGINEGFDAHMALYPKEHLYAVVLSNIQSGLLSRIPKDLEAILFGGDTSRPIEVKAETVSAATLDQYVGSYKAPEIPTPLNVVVQGGQLRVRWGSYPFLRVLTPVGKGEFFFRYEYAQVRFERNQDGTMKMNWQWPEAKPVIFQIVKPH